MLKQTKEKGRVMEFKLIEKANQLDMEFILEKLELIFHMQKTSREDCLKIIDIFRQCGRHVKASELKSDLKTGH